jgi:uncharacterized protein YegJ (DUF2314 family)
LLVVLGPLAIGVVLADESARVRKILAGKPPGVLTMDADEPAMRRALRHARDGLTDFLELAESPQRHQADFRVRVALRERNQGEVIWIANFKRDDNGLFTGYVDDDTP